MVDQVNISPDIVIKKLSFTILSTLTVLPNKVRFFCSNVFIFSFIFIYQFYVHRVLIIINMFLAEL